VDRSFKPALVLTLGRALGFVVTFFIPVVLVRVFDQGEFGAYKQLFLIFSTLFLIAQCGMAESLFYFLPRSPSRAAAHVTNAMVFLAGGGFACAVLLEGFKGSLGRWLKNPSLLEDVPFLGAFLALMLASAFLEMVMIARGEHVKAAWTYGLSDLVKAAFFVVPALVWRRLDMVFLGASVFAALRVVATLLYLHREFPGSLRPNPGALKGQLAYALPFGAAVLLETIQGNFHQYAVSYAFTPAMFAIYSVGCLNVPLVDFISGPASSVMMVRMSEALREGRPEEALLLWHDTVRKVGLLFAPLVGGLIVTAHDLVTVLFTPAYLPSVSIFRVWTTAIVWTVLMTDGVLRVYADTRFLFLLNTLRLVVNVALIFWFMSTWGLVGAVLVTVLATAITRIVALARIRTLMGVSLSRLLPWRALGGAAAAATLATLPALLLGEVLAISPLLRGILTGSVYAASFVFLLLAFDLLNDDERGGLKALVGRVRLAAPPLLEPATVDVPNPVRSREH
jgi:O-antigen/teichoic acid export membrane protein